MKRIFGVLLAVGVLSAACSSTSTVDIYRINNSGELINIGRSAKPGNEVYGHFFNHKRYDRGELNLSEADVDGKRKNVAKTCYIEFLDFEGIRLDPCQLAYMTNMGALGQPEGLDKIGIYVITLDSPMGEFLLFAHSHETKRWELLYQVPIHKAHWDAGIDVVQVDPQRTGNLIFMRSLEPMDGNPPLLVQSKVKLWDEQGQFIDAVIYENLPVYLDGIEPEEITTEPLTTPSEIVIEPMDQTLAPQNILITPVCDPYTQDCTQEKQIIITPINQPPPTPHPIESVKHDLGDRSITIQKTDP